MDEDSVEELLTGRHHGFTNSITRFKLKQLTISRAKLKSSSHISALLAGFAIVAIVELQLEPMCHIQDDVKNGTVVYKDTENVISVYNHAENITTVFKLREKCSNIPESLLVAYSVCGTLVVAVHLLALMISTCILPHVDAMNNMIKVDVHIIDDSPHVTLHKYIEIAWFFSTVLGLLLFLILIALITWVKFVDISTKASAGSTVILVPTIILFSFFAMHFYYKLVGFTVKHADTELKNLEFQLKALHDEMETTNGSKSRTSVYVV
ncbi:unnamed protein product [Meganyctiphanes norvegica]|uniref:Calcium release-activated calcium channel protein 1 n=1 Tax=Meganyctiphanes norvegica TaxID=48144 RepID=A0AAV2RIH3_MEGNR